MTESKDERRAANCAAAAALREQYGRLPKTTRARLLSDYKAELGRGANVSWLRYIEVMMPLLPSDAR